jgi:hypothetical protein
MSPQFAPPLARRVVELHRRVRSGYFRTGVTDVLAMFPTATENTLETNLTPQQKKSRQNRPSSFGVCAGKARTFQNTATLPSVKHPHFLYGTTQNFVPHTTTLPAFADTVSSTVYTTLRMSHRSRSRLMAVSSPK